MNHKNIWIYSVIDTCLSESMANKKELLILGAAVASATVGMYFYTEKNNKDDQPTKELLSSVETAKAVIEHEVQNVSSALDMTDAGSDGGLKKDVIVKKEDAVDKEDIPSEAEDEFSAKKGPSSGFQRSEEYSVGVDERKKNTSPGQDLRKDPPDPGTPAFRSLKKVYKEGYN